MSEGTATEPQNREPRKEAVHAQGVNRSDNGDRLDHHVWPGAQYNRCGAGPNCHNERTATSGNARHHGSRLLRDHHHQRSEHWRSRDYRTPRDDNHNAPGDGHYRAKGSLRRACGVSDHQRDGTGYYSANDGTRDRRSHQNWRPACG